MKNILVCLLLVLLTSCASPSQRIMATPTAPIVREVTPATVKAALLSVNPGETIQMRGGTYPVLTFGKSGYIVTAYPGETPIIAGGQVVINGTGITLSNVEITNPSGRCLEIGGTNNIADHLVVHGCDSHAVNLVGTNVTISNTLVYDAVREGMDRQGEWGSGIKVTPPGNNIYILNNRLAPSVYGEAIGVTMGRNVVVRGNVVEDAFLLSYYVDNSENVLVDSNFTYCSTYKTSKAIALGAEPYPGWNWTNILKDITVQNNVSIGCQGMHGWFDDTATIPTNIHILNNTMMNVSSGGGIAFGGKAGQSYIVRNNIYSGVYWFGSTTGVVASDNVVQGNLLVGGNVDNSASAKLASERTGFNTGLAYDFGGNARTVPLSIGAWEWDGVVVTPLPPTATGTFAPPTITNTPAPATMTFTQSPPTPTRTPTHVVPTNTRRATRTPTPTRTSTGIPLTAITPMCDPEYLPEICIYRILP